MRGLGLCGGGVGKFFRYEKENPISSSYLFPVRVSGGNKKEKLAQKKRGQRVVYLLSKNRNNHLSSFRTVLRLINLFLNGSVPVCRFIERAAVRGMTASPRHPEIFTVVWYTHGNTHNITVPSSEKLHIRAFKQNYYVL